MNSKINAIVIVAAVFLILPIMFAAFILTGFYIQPTIKKNLSAAQIDEICTKFNFELMPEETMYLEYHPGFLQGTTYLNIYNANLQLKKAKDKRCKK